MLGLSRRKAVVTAVMAPRGQHPDLDTRPCKCGCGEQFTKQQKNQAFVDGEHKNRYWAAYQRSLRNSQEIMRRYWREQKRASRARRK